MCADQPSYSCYQFSVARMAKANFNYDFIIKYHISLFGDW